MEPLVLSVLVILTSAIVPLVGIILTGRQRRTELHETWARQDRIEGKVDRVEVLVNGNVTAAMRSECRAVGREVALMNELIEIEQAQGREPSRASLSSVKHTESTLAELKATIAERVRAQEAAG